MPGKDEFKVCVRKLPPSPSESDIKDFFTRAGEVIDIFVKEGRDGWFAFVGFNNQSDLEEALKLHGREFQGCTLEVERKQVKNCFNCGKEGHVSARCPRQGDRVCFKCQRSGHVSRDCPGERRRDSRSPPRRRRDSRDRSRRRDSRSPKRSRSRSPKRTRREK